LTDEETITRLEAGDRQISGERRECLADLFRVPLNALFWEASQERRLRLV
jgi:hypothetical protein